MKGVNRNALSGLLEPIPGADETMTESLQPISPSIPQPKRGMPAWAPAYLEALEQTQGILTAAAGIVGLTYSAVYKARCAYPDLDKVVTEIKAEWDSRHLDELEELSIGQAMKPGCTTERIFNMKALNPRRYRDKQTGPEFPGNITINFGASIGGGSPETIVMRPDGKILTEIPADAEVREIPSRASRERNSGADILSEEDLNVDI